MRPRHTTETIPATAALLAGRLLLALLFVHEGWSIISTYGAAAAYMQQFGVPAQLLPAVIALELGGGFSIAAGAFTRLLAPAFAIFCGLTAALFHRSFADSNQLLHLQKDLAIAGGFLVLAVSGPGDLSADRYLGISSWLYCALLRRTRRINARNVREAGSP